MSAKEEDKVYLKCVNVHCDVKECKNNFTRYPCRDCGEIWLKDTFNFCPMCGKKLDWENYR